MQPKVIAWKEIEAFTQHRNSSQVRVMSCQDITIRAEETLFLKLEITGSVDGLSYTGNLVASNYLNDNGFALVNPGRKLQIVDRHTFTVSVIIHNLLGVSRVLSCLSPWFIVQK